MPGQRDRHIGRNAVVGPSGGRVILFAVVEALGLSIICIDTGSTSPHPRSRACWGRWAAESFGRWSSADEGACGRRPSSARGRGRTGSLDIVVHDTAPLTKKEIVVLFLVEMWAAGSAVVHKASIDGVLPRRRYTTALAKVVIIVVRVASSDGKGFESVTARAASMLKGHVMFPFIKEISVPPCRAVGSDTGPTQVWERGSTSHGRGRVRYADPCW